jgi:hypothetical protein
MLFFGNHYINILKWKENFKLIEIAEHIPSEDLSIIEIYNYFCKTCEII